jgi:hypothetical protein
MPANVTIFYFLTYSFLLGVWRQEIATKPITHFPVGSLFPAVFALPQHQDTQYLHTLPATHN